MEATAEAARGTGAGARSRRLSSLRRAHVILPPLAVIERAAITGRAQARQRVQEALSRIAPAQGAALERLLIIDLPLGTTPLAWLKACRSAPKADRIRYRGSA
jgi:hypothetical protein